MSISYDNNRRDAAIHISCEAANEKHRESEEEASKVADMDGVDVYPLSRTMTAKELARHRLPKRNREDAKTMPANKSSLQEAIQTPVEQETQLRIEQDDNELMIGQNDVWESKYTATPSTSVFEQEFNDSENLSFDDDNDAQMAGPYFDEDDVDEL